jgi:acyl-CoA-binding protein
MSGVDPQTELVFKKVVWLIRYAPPHEDFKKPSNDLRLIFYKYFKQATVGDVQGDCPSIIKLESNLKWKAWKSVKGMSRAEAIRHYIAEFAGRAGKYDDDWLAKLEAHGILDNFTENGDWIDWKF